MRTQILASEWYCIHNIKLPFYKLFKKPNQASKFNITDKIKVNTITVNKVEYMTNWHENESYWTIRITY